MAKGALEPLGAPTSEVAMPITTGNFPKALVKKLTPKPKKKAKSTAKVNRRTKISGNPKTIIERLTK